MFLLMKMKYFLELCGKWTAKYIDTEAKTEYTSRQNWHVIRLADAPTRAEAMAEISGNYDANENALIFLETE